MNMQQLLGGILNGGQGGGGGGPFAAFGMMGQGQWQQQQQQFAVPAPPPPPPSLPSPLRLSVTEHAVVRTPGQPPIACYRVESMRGEQSQNHQDGPNAAGHGSNDSRVSWKRFSEFEQLHRQLKQLLTQSYHHLLPPIPSTWKDAFKAKDDPTVMSARQEKLHEYMGGIAALYIHPMMMQQQQHYPGRSGRDIIQKWILHHHGLTPHQHLQAIEREKFDQQRQQQQQQQQRGFGAGGGDGNGGGGNGLAALMGMMSPGFPFNQQQQHQPQSQHSAHAYAHQQQASQQAQQQPAAAPGHAAPGAAPGPAPGVHSGGPIGGNGAVHPFAPGPSASNPFAGLNLANLLNPAAVGQPGFAGGLVNSVLQNQAQGVAEAQRQQDAFLASLPAEEREAALLRSAVVRRMVSTSGWAFTNVVTGMCEWWGLQLHPGAGGEVVLIERRMLPDGITGMGRWKAQYQCRLKSAIDVDVAGGTVTLTLHSQMSRMLGGGGAQANPRTVKIHVPNESAEEHMRRNMGGIPLAAGDVNGEVGENHLLLRQQAQGSAAGANANIPPRILRIEFFGPFAQGFFAGTDMGMGIGGAAAGFNANHAQGQQLIRTFVEGAPPQPIAHFPVVHHH